jgi:hypothetical protein
MSIASRMTRSAQDDQLVSGRMTMQCVAVLVDAQTRCRQLWDAFEQR